MVKFSVKKPLTVFVAVLAVLVLGVVAYLKMTPDLLPNMDFPYVVIVTTDPGASPEAVESAVTRPMEQSMSTLDRIKSVTSTSQDSVSMVVLEFEDGVNMDTVSVDIQQKINILQGSWDDGVGTPYVLKINPSMLPVQVAAVSYSGKDVTELSDFVENTLTQKLEGISFLAQGTIYPDILESDGIKSHHNVGGLPEDLQFELVEPVKLLYKDEVRVVGKALGLPDNMVYRQPFPGPGLGVRCIGAITRDRLEAVRESDAILREEFAKNGLEGKVWQYFTVVPDIKSTGIIDGKRSFDWPVIIRAVNTVDAVTAEVAQLDFGMMQHIVDRITHEVSGVNRVLWDLTPKPTGTIEWE